MDPKNVSKKCLFFVSSKSPKLLLEFQSCHVFVQIVFVYSLACHKHCQTLLLVNLIEGRRPKAKNENKNKDAFPYITVFCLSVCLLGKVPKTVSSSNLKCLSLIIMCKFILFSCPKLEKSRLLWLQFTCCLLFLCLYILYIFLLSVYMFVPSVCIELSRIPCIFFVFLRGAELLLKVLLTCFQTVGDSPCTSFVIISSKRKFFSSSAQSLTYADCHSNKGNCDVTVTEGLISGCERRGYVASRVEQFINNFLFCRRRLLTSVTFWLARALFGVGRDMPRGGGAQLTACAVDADVLSPNFCAVSSGQWINSAALDSVQSRKSNLLGDKKFICSLTAPVSGGARPTRPKINPLPRQHGLSVMWRTFHLWNSALSDASCCRNSNLLGDGGRVQKAPTVRCAPIRGLWLASADCCPCRGCRTRLWALPPSCLLEYFYQTWKFYLIVASSPLYYHGG